MPRAKRFALFLLVAATAVGLPDTALCGTMCDCSPWEATESNVRSGYRSADVVFVGKVLRISSPRPKQLRRCRAQLEDRQPSCDGNRIRLRVQRAWKGVQDRVVILAGTGWNCDYEFVVGKEYLVYANSSEVWSLPTASYCGLTRPVSQASLDLSLIGEPEFDWSDA